MQLSELRKELEFNTELVQLLDTLKNIAAAQYHVMEKEKRAKDRKQDPAEQEEKNEGGWTNLFDTADEAVKAQIHKRGS